MNGMNSVLRRIIPAKAKPKTLGMTPLDFFNGPSRAVRFGTFERLRPADTAAGGADRLASCGRVRTIDTASADGLRYLGGNRAVPCEGAKGLRVGDRTAWW